MLEREVKLSVGDSFEVARLGDLSEVKGAGTPGPITSRDNHDIYFDTATFRLARWGVTLRHRRRDGWTVKLPTHELEGAMARHEHLIAGPLAAQPPAEAVKLVSSFTLAEELVEVARLNTHRTACSWYDADGARQFEICLDEVVAHTASGADPTISEIEVELDTDTKGTMLDVIVERLVALGAFRTEQSPKLVQVIGAEAALDPDVVEHKLGKHPTGRAVIQAAFARSAIALLHYIPAARVGEDPEGVHQARVATRTLRSDLTTFRPLLDEAWARDLQEELRWLTDALGEVRDADVLGGRLGNKIGQLPSSHSASADRLLDLLSSQRRDARERLLGLLDSPKARQLFEHVVAAGCDPPTLAAADEPASECLPALVEKRWRRLRRAVNKLGDHPPVADLHRVRILAKRTRYAAEAVAPAFGKKARKFAQAVEGVQDVLGNLNDTEVAELWLAEAAPKVDNDAAFVAGRLAEMFAAEGLTYRHGWERSYNKAAQPNLQAWFQHPVSRQT